MRYAHRARAHDPPRVKNSGSNPFWGVLGGLRARNETVSTHAGTISAIIGRIRTYFGTTGRKCGRGHRLVESGYMRKSQKSPFFEPRPIEAGPFIFLYEIAAMSLNWTENFEKGRSAALGPLVAYRASEQFRPKTKKSGSNPVLGHFWLVRGLFRTPMCSSPRMMPLFGPFCIAQNVNHTGS